VFPAPINRDTWSLVDGARLEVPSADKNRLFVIKSKKDSVKQQSRLSIVFCIITVFGYKISVVIPSTEDFSIILSVFNLLRQTKIRDRNCLKNRIKFLRMTKGINCLIKKYA